MPLVRVVTDSASDMPPELAAAHGIIVVPLSVHFGDVTYIDGQDLSAEQFYTLLAGNPHFPRTSQPSAGRFEEVYTRLRDEGAEVVSVHLSSRLSGTYNTAAMAARAVEGAQVHVVDSLTACMAQGDLALAAARLAAEGLPAAEIARRVEAWRPRVEVAIMLDNLAHLQRGGRIGRAQSMLGTLLNIKPIVSVEEGIVVPKQRVRTTGRALREMADEVKSRGPLASLRVEHSNAPRLVEEFLPLLRPLAPGGEVPVHIIGPVVGTHVGSGAIGVLTMRAEDPP